jgi:hypothetical protein
VETHSVQQEVIIGWQAALTGLTMTVSGFFAMGLMVLGVARLGFAGRDSDPFAPYDAIMPGQSSAVLNDFPCKFYSDSLVQYAPTLCTIRAAQGDIKNVMILVDDQISQVSYVSFISESLRYGDLVRHWGRPDVIRKIGMSLFLDWGIGVHAVIQLDNPNRQQDYLMEVNSLNAVRIPQQATTSGD